MTTKFGCSGYVDLSGPVAKKYSIFNSMYWIREYAILLYLWPYQTQNIIKFERGSFVKRFDKETNKLEHYYEMIFPKCRLSLTEFPIYKDNIIIQILLDVLSAIKFLHSIDIIHRDIKPDNILINYLGNKKSQARAVLIDFSHSVRDICATSYDAYVVTYPYRAPELFNYDGVNNYDCKIDVWAIGIILFELITGVSPHKIKNDKSDKKTTMSEAAFGDFIKSNQYLDVITESYRENKRSFFWHKEYMVWIKKMLCRNPNDRISAVDMYNEIMQFADDNKIIYKIPENGLDKLTIAIPRIETSCDKELFDRSMDLAHKYRNDCFTQISDMLIIEKVLIHFIACRTLTEKNLSNMLAAICAVISNIVYDDLLPIDTILSFLESYKLSKQSIIFNIKKVIIIHDADLVLTDLLKLK